MSIEIAGMAHVQLTVNDLQRAMPFYEKVLGFLGMRPVVKAPNGLYMIGGRTAVLVTRSSEENREFRAPTGSRCRAGQAVCAVPRPCIRQ